MTTTPGALERTPERILFICRGKPEIDYDTGESYGRAEAEPIQPLRPTPKRVAKRRRRSGKRQGWLSRDQLP